MNLSKLPDDLVTLIREYAITEIRVAVIGPGGIGKSEILRRLCLGSAFQPKYTPTYRKACYTLNMQYVRFLITEYSGQEQLRYIPKDELDSITSYIVVSAPGKISENAVKIMQKKLPKHIPHYTIMNKSDTYKPSTSKQYNSCCAKKNLNLRFPFRYIAAKFNAL